ncbi:hypothetical protein N7478_009119 [Penicillium angulare]|uniref:uncharacterized protein n=1 Tax=Penicillium angulare TaxID=116970 RepID=UPI002540F874|nr:uncharacterized protein N7478_009119 [Penicillium angulare]KAJ5273994.1 hypothetical protein N7478_009119 [Penicillium angulare]
MKSEPRRNASSSHCRDVGAHIQSRSHVGLGERLKEAWKSALPNKGKGKPIYLVLTSKKCLLETVGTVHIQIAGYGSTHEI